MIIWDGKWLATYPGAVASGFMVRLKTMPDDN